MDDVWDEAWTWPQHHFSRDERHQLSWWTTQNWSFLLQCSYSMYRKWIQASLRVQMQSHFYWWAAWRPQLWRILGDDPSSSGARLQMHSSEQVSACGLGTDAATSCLIGTVRNVAADSPAQEVRAVRLQHCERQTRYITVPNILFNPGARDTRTHTHSVEHDAATAHHLV